ncbi:MAG: hypothetical protein DA408_01860 [Bacteroidetes bacterium]|nr:MAG: hypothetical protein C7N36_02715 [Bacteroidota bacterium]PTM14786.1 MAG: hypothetical protein DA408_01860 [Bacteroidota bacterium]
MKYLLLTVFTVLLSWTVNAQEIFTATLSGRQEALPVATPASGTLTAELNGTTLTVSGSFQDLSGDFNPAIAGGSHLHLATAGSNGSIVFALVPVLDTDLKGGAFLAAANTFTLTEEQVTALRNREFYANIHTTRFGSGELRGQLLPAAADYYWINLFGSNENPDIITDAAGALALTVVNNELVVSGSFANLSSPLATTIAGGVHLHIAAAGSNGPVAIRLNPTTAPDGLSAVFLAADNTFELTAEQATALAASNVYANVHSLNFTGGEIRGQALPISRVVFRADLAASNEFPYTTSFARGQVLLTMTDDELIVTGSLAGLESDLATAIAGGIHLHQAAAGSNGAVIIPLTIDLNAGNRNGTILASNNTYPLTPELEEILLNRQFYINVHSETNTGGEIRGQVLPECQFVLTAVLSGTQEIPDVSTAAQGMVKLEVSGNRAVASGSFNNLSSGLNVAIAGGAHLHLGLPGELGPVAYLLNATVAADGLSGTFGPSDNVIALDAANRSALVARGMYVNVHTLANAGGEIRGAVLGEAANYFFAPLSGASETTPVNSPARGMLALEVNSNGSVAVGSFQNLGSDLATNVAGGAHIHTQFAGRNGSILSLLNVTGTGTTGVFAAADNKLTFSSGALDTLRERMWYVNVHSVNNPGGEIRGQVLPMATGYFHTSLSGINETSPLAVSGTGSLKLELVNNKLVVTGGFGSLVGEFAANVGGGAHLHLGNTGSNGAVDIPLAATVATDNLSGYFAAANNTFTLTDDQLTSLRSGGYYANIHTQAQTSGEIRGQILPEVNFFPTASEIELPAEGTTLTIAGNALTEFTATWLPTTDPDGDLVAYVWQLALDEAFTTVLFSTATAQEAFFTTNFGTVDALLAANGVTVGAAVTLYHRVVVTDGSNATPGAAKSVVLTRGEVTATNNILARLIQLEVYPNQTSGAPVTLAITSDRRIAAEVLLVNGLGQTLQQQKTELVEGEMRLPLELSALPAGRYFVMLRIDGQVLPAQPVLKF